jgi:hypothetical protein
MESKRCRKCNLIFYELISMVFYCPDILFLFVTFIRVFIYKYFQGGGRAAIFSERELEAEGEIFLLNS